MTPEELTLAELREFIHQMPEESRMRIAVIVSTFQNCIKLDEKHASLALALVGAEMAARP
jgi:hypothetical protein